MNKPSRIPPPPPNCYPSCQRHTRAAEIVRSGIIFAGILGGIIFDAIVDCLREHTGCVIHVVQGTNPLTGVMDEDTFIVQDF